MASELPRPGVEVVQVFTEASPTVVIPTLPAVIIAEACQIESKETAGLFDNVAATFAYPKLVVGATVDLAEVFVFLVTAEDTFDITNDSVVTITATGVTVGANPSPQKTIIANDQTTVKAGQTFEDLDADFFTSDVRVGDILCFEDVLANLVALTSKASNNLGEFIITRVSTKTKMEIIGKTPAKLVGSLAETFDITPGGNDLFVIDVDGGGDLSIILTAGSAVTAQSVADDLNADSAFSAAAIADVFNRKLRVRSRTLGAASSLTIGFASPTANAILGFTLAQTDTGSDNASLIAETDVEYKVIRKGSKTGTILITYIACRTDEAAQFFTWADIAAVEKDIGDSSTPKNPLGYGAARALATSGGLAVHGVIVKDGDDVDSHQKALEFLSSQQVYGMVPLSQDQSVRDLYPIHVSLMSEPENKKERVVWLNPIITSFEEFQVSSQTAATPIAVPGPTANTFIDPAAKFLENGVPIGAVLRITATENPLEIDTVVRTLPFEIQIQTIDLETSVDTIGNFTADPGKVTYSVKSKDFTQSQKALNQRGIAEGYNNSRVRVVHPDKARFSVNSVIETHPATFLCAAIAGMRSGLPPAQGFTNLPVPGATELIGSDDVMSETDLNVLAGGGVFILVQDVVAGPITVRHQLTTAIGDIKTREDNIISAVDFSSKIFRDNLKHLIGRFNLTPEYIEQQLRPAAAGILEDLKELKVVGRLTNIVSMQAVAGKIDTVEMVIDYVALVPVNKIRVILQI